MHIPGCASIEPKLLTRLLRALRPWLLFLCVVTGPAGAEENVSGLQEPEQQERFRELTWELRCPKCQNQNIADSNAPVAADLRAEIVRLLQEGRSNAEIVDFMVQRYGEFVLYQPRARGVNLLLWIIPGLCLLIGIAIIVVRAGRGARAEQDSTALSEAERQRLQALTRNDGDAQ